MPVDLSLLQVGDVLYCWGPRRGVGNTTATHRTVEKRTVIEIRPANERGVVMIDVSDGYRVFGKVSHQLAREYTPHHPKPERRPFSSNDSYYEREVANAAEKATASRKVWAERRKAKRAAKKAALNKEKSR